MFRTINKLIKSDANTNITTGNPLTIPSNEIALVMGKARGSFLEGDLDAAEKDCRFVLSAAPNHAEAWYYLGLTAHRRGGNTEALEYLRNASECDPEWAEACNHYGNALRANGRFDEALEKYQRASRLKNDYAAPHYNIGLVLVSQKRTAEAEHSFKRALEIDPCFVAAWNGLGLLHHDQGKSGEAVVHFREALRCNPESVEALNNLGIALIALKQGDEAVEICRKAVSVAPNCAAVHISLGIALREVELIDDAIACYRRALELDPDSPEAFNNLGQIFTDLGRLGEAEDCCRRALALRPSYPEALNNLGIVLKEKGLTNEASETLKVSLKLQPDSAITWYNLGLVRKEQGDLEGSIYCYRQALNRRPDYSDALSNMGGALTGQGRIKEALAIYRKALESDSPASHVYSNMLMTMQYSPSHSPEEIFAESRRWEKLYGGKVRMNHTNVPDPDRTLRIGYVSPDFRRHSVSYFLRALFSHHSKTNVSIFCYSDVPAPDGNTDFFMSYADFWRNTCGLSDDEVTRLVEQDSIDILIDLSAHTWKRLPIFSRKPAPVQITWLGYPNTTGISAIDYRFTDDIADPVGESDRYHAEKLYCLAGGFLCYTPPEEAPEVAPLPFNASGHITFGSFNSIAKITPEVIRLWSNLLFRIPDARLIIKTHSLADGATRRRYADLLDKNGVSPGRVDLRPWERGTASHLALYGDIDIALDPFPYNGTTTTCESLWMGVPVITLAGERHAGRVGASILTRVGLADLVVESLDEYLVAAEALARDSGRLSRIRNTLRETMLTSSLCDGAGFAATIENAYRRIWHNWCSDHSNSAE